jgi:tetratricopeptide (TPR) repeat protein
MKATGTGRQLRFWNRQVFALVITSLAATLLVSCAGTPEGGERTLSDAEILMKKGDGYYFNDRHNEAVREYTAALAADPRSAGAHRNRGYAWLALRETEKAKADFDRAVEIAPDFAEAYLARGGLYYIQGKYAEAIDDFDRVIELDPWNATARYYKALACEKVGRLREAVEAYRGYIHCVVPREGGSEDFARERIQDLEKRLPD